MEDSKIKDFIENPEGNDPHRSHSVIDDEITSEMMKRVVIEGDPTKDLFTAYRMVFLREHGAQ